ncbi:transporter substrate-binding domain-containing protein [Pseudophaeobacter sp.]|jgi:polar amino acid transport system substrate-binding protein|uniref:Transporter substrate-binding domain-containing protein n=1 Tax=Pseudophaeobacter arcticus TaxID=385492 RepID=A0ABQ0AL84_9RHOB|nr:transporter substrate-binding domain-containing protein [uncultured Pseudophaeobacter sp.]UWS78422.1 transporter substrate-binding domain-containing protein [Phaeobacter sp. G2]
MKSLILTTAALALTAGMGLADTVRLGTEGAYPPYNFLNDNGEVDGFERELGDELCKRAELTCEWVTNDWDSIIPNLLSGNYDAIIAGMSITPERKEVVQFTQGYTRPSPSAFAALSADVDLTSAVISAQASTIQSSHVAGTGATLVEFPTPDETIAAVNAGEADAVMADKDFLLPIVDETDLQFVGEDVFLGDGIGMAFRQSDTDVIAKFDAAIASMKEDGSLNMLLDKWEIEGKF